jgi:hypothetical protein
MIDLDITQTLKGDAAFIRALTVAGRAFQSAPKLVAVADAVALTFRAKAAGAVVRVNGQVQ